MIIHHVRFVVASLEAKAFYLSALAPIGLEVVYASDTAVGLGVNRKAALWLRTRRSAEEALTTGQHIAFAAKNKEQVHKFHPAALKAGGTDNGPPGPRNNAPGYYAAYVIDPQGNNIEVIVA